MLLRKLLFGSTFIEMGLALAFRLRGSLAPIAPRRVGFRGSGEIDGLGSLIGQRIDEECASCMLFLLIKIVLIIADDSDYDPGLPVNVHVGSSRFQRWSRIRQHAQLSTIYLYDVVTEGVIPLTLCK